MPLLAGGRLGDASGNTIVDSSPNYLGEPSLQVVVDSSGVLYSANQGLNMAGSIDLGQIIEDLADIGEVLQNLVNGSLTMQAIRNLQDDLNAFLLNGGPDTFTGHDPTSHPSLITAEGIINSIEPGGGGLTTEEHDKLMGLSGSGLTTDEHDRLYGIPQYNLQANEVWGYVLGVDDLNQTLGGLDAAQTIANLWDYVTLKVGYEGIALTDNPHWSFIAYNAANWFGWYGNYFASPGDTFCPKLDLSLVQAGDTLLGYLQREYPGYNYATNWPNSTTGAKGVFIKPYEGPPEYGYRCNLTDADIAALWPVTVSTETVEVTNQTVEVTNQTVEVDMPHPPAIDSSKYAIVWGTAIPFDAPFVANVACDGIKFTIDTTAPRIKAWNVGDYTVLSGAGAVGFLDDDGNPEPYQWLGYDHGIVLPTSIKRPAGFIFSSNVSTSGVVTPFTLEEIT